MSAYELACRLHNETAGWDPRDVAIRAAAREACPECGGSGVDATDPGERCPVCKGRGR